MSVAKKSRPTGANKLNTAMYWAVIPASSPSAPKERTRGPLSRTPNNRNSTEMTTISLTDPENTLLADSTSPFPRCMDTLTEDPAAIMSTNAITTVMTGHARFTAASASLPRKFPTNIPSTIEQRAHTRPETMPGTAHLTNRRPTGILPYISCSELIPIPF